MPSPASCCTCATLLTDVKVPYDPASEKPLLHNRRLACCSREICAACQHRNPRFQSYCPFCQISSGPSALPRDGLRLPPVYTRTAKTNTKTEAETAGEEGEQRSRQGGTTESPPPSYTESTMALQVQGPRLYDTGPDIGADASTSTSTSTSSTPPTDTEDTVHFVGPEDSLQSLSLAYKIPGDVLRRHNNLYSDQLLAARKWIVVPRSHYAGPSLSTPPDPGEEARKTTLRRWMVATKCVDYGVAMLYLKGTDYDLDIAVDAFKADEEWERSHPMEPKGKGAARDRERRFGHGGSLSGQLS